MPTERQKATLLRLLWWQAYRRWRVLVGVLMVALAPIPDGLFGKGWSVGIATAAVTLVALLVGEAAITAWLHWQKKHAA